MDHPDQKKKNQQTSELNCTIEQMDLAAIHTILHPSAVEYPFSAAHGTFSKQIAF
jgi:hypothetical protein